VNSKRTLTLFAVLYLGLASLASAQTNVLVNGDFELNPPPGFGDNRGHSIFPWVLGTGDEPNVVKVDGPGGFDYGTRGPESDASAAGPRRVRHYLDIVNGQNEFYQSFSPQCSGTVVFGASFSTRANDPGIATVRLLEGVGTAGALVASGRVSLPRGNSRTDPWRQVTFTAPVEALETYSLVIFMADELNVDNVFARFVERCDPPDPCCPPWNSALLESMLFYESAGGIGSNYTLKFRPSDPWKGQMQAYLDYLHTRNALITDLNLAFRLHDAGPGTNPSASGPQVGMTYFTWFLEGGNGVITGATDFFALGGESMQVNRWYRVETGIFLNDRLTFFPVSCAENRIFVRIQVRRSAAAAPARAQVEFLLPDGSVVTRGLEAEFR
jgi:hypothetical protein